MLVALLFSIALAPQAAAEPAPVCGSGPLEPLRRALLAELNRKRAERDARPVEPHATLCEIARRRAVAVAASGSADPSMALLQETTRALYAAGYPPHEWTQSSLIADPLQPALEQWQALRPGFVEEALAGDFEHVGVGVRVRGGQPAYSLLLALHKCTAEWRRVAPLQDLDASRRELLEAVARVRAERGLPPIAGHPALDRAAQLHAEDMLERGYYSHRSPEGVKPRRRIADAGFAGSRWTAENIAKGLFTPAEAVERWMNSSGHRDNLLRPAARATGVGIAVGRAPSPECLEVVWVQLFAGPPR